MSDSWGGNRVGGCRGHIRAVAGLAGGRSRSPPWAGTEIQASPRVAVLHSCHRDRLQFVSRHRHLHRCPSPQAEPSLRSNMASCAGSHRNPLHPPGARSRRRRERLPPTCLAASDGMCKVRARQHRAGRKDAARQRRQFQRSRRRPVAERVRHRHVPRARSRRHRGKVQRNSGGAGAAGRTRRPGRRARHTRCDTLSKKHSRSPSRPTSP